MNRSPERNLASVMMAVPLAARLFIGMSLESTQSGCASWMCPLIGLLISAPLLVCLRIVEKSAENSVLCELIESVPRAAAAAILLPLVTILVCDCAGIVRLTANTANINALNSATTLFLVLPVAAVVGIMILLGANAAGRNARIWMVLLPIPLLVIVAVQLRAYEPAWLTPILGGGIRSLIRNGLECAGIISMFTLIRAISIPDERERSVFLYAFLTVCAASALLALFQMLAPVRTQVVLSRASRLKMILSNGRVALILQIVMILVWYGSILHIISVEAATAAHIVEMLFPKLKVSVLAAFLALIIGVFASSQLAKSENFRSLELYRFHAVGGLMLLIFMILYFSARRKKKCAD